MDIIYASAGSGKTTELVNRFIKKIINGENPNNIFCLTFTNKSMNEIKDRIKKNISLTVSNDNDMIKILNIKKLTKKEIDYLNKSIDIDYKVFTIDSFLYKILKFINWENRRLAESEEILNIVEKSSSEFFIKKFKQENNMEDLIKILKNIYLNKRPSFHKINNQDSKLSFLKKELDKENLEKRIISKLKTFKGEVFQELSLSEDILNDFLNSKLITKYKSFDYKITNKLSQEEKKDLDNIYLYIKAFNYLKNNNKTINNIFEFYNEYEELIENQKRIRNIMDYNDIIIELNKVLEDEDNIMTFQYYIFNNIGHMMVDEYQDTSFYQDEILSFIFEQLKEGENNITEIPSIFIVGDVKQSIYEWRDADSNIFKNKKQLLLNSGEPFVIFKDDKKIDELKNDDFFIEPNLIQFNNSTRRIHPNIIKVINNEFKDKNMDSFMEHQTFRNEEVKSKYLNLNFENNEEIINNVIEQIILLKKEGKEFKDIAVISRNNEMLNLLEEKIKLNYKINIPTKKDNGGMSKTEEFKFINNLILTIFMKQNDLYLLKTLENLFDNSEINKYFNNERNNNEINIFVSKINKIRETNEDIYIKLNRMIFELDLVSIMFKFNKVNSISILNRYTEYLLDVLPFVKNENIFIERILNIKYNSSLISNIKEEEDSVHLLTIHKSKGLEFDSVILLKQDIFENRSYGLNISSNGKIYNLGYKKSEIPYEFKDYKNEREEFIEKERQEQLRLYYVGLTRCKNNLITIDKK